MFVSFSGADRAHLAQSIAGGQLTAAEVNDGLVGALKGERKRQLWRLVAAEQQASPTVDLANAPKGWSKDIALEAEALGLERGRVKMELLRLRLDGAAETVVRRKTAELQQLENRHAEIGAAMFWDISQPATMIGAEGRFFDANWPSGAEQTARDKLSAQGALTAGMLAAIVAMARRDAQDSLIVRAFHWAPDGRL